MHWNPTAITFTVITFCSTMAGGLFTLRFHAKLHYFLAFSAGALVSVALLDLLPAALAIALSASVALPRLCLTAVVAFVAYHLLEKLILIHTHAQEEGSHEHIIGGLGAGAMIGHSFMDGIAIGAGFETNFHLGLMIGLAVIMHDYADGTNTMSILLQSKASRKKSLGFLICDAAAPTIGAFATLLVFVPEIYLAFILAWFAGAFIYLGAADLLPTAHALRSSNRTILATVIGVGFVVFLTSVFAL